MNKLIKLRNYNFLVSVKNTQEPPKSKWPREVPRVGTIRGYQTIYYNYDDMLSKEIIYPQKLWFSTIEENDQLELDLIELKNTWPSWYRIRVLNKII